MPCCWAVFRVQQCCCGHNYDGTTTVNNAAAGTTTTVQANPEPARAPQEGGWIGFVCFAAGWCSGFNNAAAGTTTTVPHKRATMLLQAQLRRCHTRGLYVSSVAYIHICVVRICVVRKSTWLLEHEKARGYSQLVLRVVRGDRHPCNMFDRARGHDRHRATSLRCRRLRRRVANRGRRLRRRGGCGGAANRGRRRRRDGTWPRGLRAVTGLTGVMSPWPHSRRNTWHVATPRVTADPQQLLLTNDRRFAGAASRRGASSHRGLGRSLKADVPGCRGTWPLRGGGSWPGAVCRGSWPLRGVGSWPLTRTPRGPLLGGPLGACPLAPLAEACRVAPPPRFLPLGNDPLRDGLPRGLDAHVPQHPQDGGLVAVQGQVRQVAVGAAPGAAKGSALWRRGPFVLIGRRY